MSAKMVQLRQGRKQHNATISRGRQGNEVYRVREHLTEAEIEKRPRSNRTDVASANG